MKIRDLRWKAGRTVVSTWPPVWVTSFGQGSRLPFGEDGVLESVSQHPQGDRLSLTMRFDGREHLGGLQWDPPPTLKAVEDLLRANIGRDMKAIGNLDV
jgi:hypothetical protein